MSFAGINAGQQFNAGSFRVGGTAAAFVGTNGDALLIPIQFYAPLTRITRTCITPQVSSGNMEIGIWDATFQKIASTGVVLMSNAMNGLVVTLRPDRYWLVIATSTNVAQVFGGPNNAISRILVGAGLPIPDDLSASVDTSPSVVIPRVLVYQ